MLRWMTAAAVMVLASCGTGTGTDSEAPPESGSEPHAAFDASLLGRWDVTVQGEDRYPLWFELTDEGDTVAGRMQGRFGHALPMENVMAMGGHAMWNVGKSMFHSNLVGDEIHGSGTTADGASFEWVAVRAPELPAPSSPEWGAPVELFNGENLTGWKARDPEAPSHWRADDGILVNEDAGTDLVTEASFENFRLHVEVNVPEGSNSGVYLRGRYEVQVQDDHGKEPHALFMGGIYGQVTPTSNPALPAGEWQTFDITLLGRFVTVVLNGETIIDNEEIPGTTGGALDANEAEPGPIFLQGDHGKILYRNLVLTPAN